MNKLMAWVVIVMATLLPACCVFNGVRHPEPRPNLAEVLESKTVALDHWIGKTGEDEDGDPTYGEVDPDQDPKAELRPYCAGVWISHDVILTAEHCVDDLGKPPIMQLLQSLGANVEPWDPTGQAVTYSGWGDVRDEGVRKIRSAHQATVLAVDMDHDLALVKATPDAMDSIPQHPVATLAHETRVGDDVHIVGHTVGLWWSYTRGWVAQLRPGMPGVNEKPVDVLQISAPIWFGNSGGGAFNSDGELLGIASWLRKAPNVGFFVDYNTIRSFLAHNQIKR